MASLRRSPVFSFLSALALGSIILTTLLPALAFGAPLVVISRPVQGAVVSGQIWIDVNFQADKNLPIVRLEVYIDDQLARESDLAQPMLIGHQSFSWDFSYSSNSVHKIGARAIDSGNNAGAASIAVTVQNTTATGPDVIAPVVRIYYPAQGTKVFGRTEIKAEAKDDVGVEMVVFYIDGKLHKVMMNAPPYVDSWDTTREDDGLHVLEATAVDKAENEARSAQVTVIVENHSMTTMDPGSGSVKPQGVTPSPLPTTPPNVTMPPTTSEPAVPAPAPVAPGTTAVPVPGPAPVPAGPQSPPNVTLAPPGPAATNGPAAGAGSTVAPPPAAPQVVNVAPWAPPPTYIPPAPNATTAPLGPSNPVAIGSGHQAGLTPAPSVKGLSPGASAALPRPGVSATLPGATGNAASTAKVTAPPDASMRVDVGTAPAVRSTTPESVPGPVAMPQAPSGATPKPLLARGGATLTPIAPLLTIGTPQLAKGVPLLPIAAKTAAPVGTVSHDISGRTTDPGRATLAVRAAPQDETRVVPVGPAVATLVKPAISVQSATPLTPERPSQASGLSRVTPPRAIPATAPPALPAKVAIGVHPSVAPLVVNAALAEYRGLPVPASRMLARLPDPVTGKLSADGRITNPRGDIAAVPIAVRKVSDIKIVFDGEVLSLRATPETRRGISLAPLREIFEQTDGVLYWFPVEKQVHAVNNNVDMKLKIGDRAATVNGERRVLAVAPFIKRGRTMVPLQFIADVLDVNIAVDSATGQITISSNQL